MSNKARAACAARRAAEGQSCTCGPCVAETCGWNVQPHCGRNDVYTAHAVRARAAWGFALAFTVIAAFAVV